MSKIRIGIIGYGNIGRGVEKAVLAAPDMEMRAVFTRRDPKSVTPCSSSALVLPIGEAEKMTGEIDVMLLCGGSAKDLPEQGPHYAALFNTVDSFDTHARIPEYIEKLDAAAKKTTAVVSAGWDPGLFSMMRLLSDSILPDGKSYTFWGRGVSQGHSDAIRQIEGVKRAIQYTVPIQASVDAARSGSRPELTAREKVFRECYVVVYPGADKASIEKTIKNMPNYFSDYDTSVCFIEDDEFIANHSKMPHAGLILHNGNTGESNQTIEFSLKLDSNPEFTGSILTAYARAAHRMASEGLYGAKTVYDIPLAYLSYKDRATFIKDLT